jgi:hypothetical protein
MPLSTITQLQPFNINASATFSFASTSVTANVSAGNILTDNLLYANGTAWQFTNYSNTNVAAYLPTYTGQMANALVAGTVYTAAQPNITSVGTLTSLTASGLITATAGGIKVGNIQDPSGTNTISLLNGNVSVTGDITAGAGGAGNVTATYFIGNGSQLTGLPASYSNANVANYLPTYTGNVAGAYFIGNGSTLTDITGANVTGYVPLSTAANTAGTVTTAAQPNITSVGTLSSLSVTGNVSVNYIIGNGSTLTNLTGANVTGYVPLANEANTATSATTAGTVTTNAQPNITSVGNLVNANVDGNLLVTGNLTVNGNTNYVNVDTLVVEDPVIELGGGPNGNPLTTNDGKDRGTLLHYYTTTPVDAFMGWDNSNGEFAFGSNVTLTSEVATFNTFGNVRVGNIIGNGQALTGITGGNVTGQVANALVAGTVYSNAQPNITSTGTLSSVTVSGLTTATGGLKTGNIQDTAGTNTISVSSTSVGIIGNLIVGTGGSGNVTATYFIGNGSQLTGLPASYSNANVASGGSADYVLKTDGAGNLSWAAQTGGGGGGIGLAIGSVEVFTADGSGNTYTLTTTPSNEDQITVNIDGVLQLHSSFSLTGNVVTLDGTPVTGAKVEITNFNSGGAAGSNTQIQFNDSSNIAGSAALTFDKTSNTLNATNITANGTPVATTGKAIAMSIVFGG